MSLMVKAHYRLRAQYYTPMAKPLGVTVPGSKTSYMVGSAPLHVETRIENPLVAITREITESTLTPLSVKELRVILDAIRALSADIVSKSGRKADLIQRILTSPTKELAVQRFLADKELGEQCKIERIIVKHLTSLRGALRQAGVEILQTLNLPYSVSSLPEDKLPDGAHPIGECPDPEKECLLCQVFGSLKHSSLFKTYIPPLVDDPEHNRDILQEMNHVLIRTHARNVHRPGGRTFNFNQQYFAGDFTTYLEFPQGLPSPVVLGFLLNCLEWCVDVGAAKAWGAGKLFLRSYALEKVEQIYEPKWTDSSMHLTPKRTITPLRDELEQALAEYAGWLAKIQTPGHSPETTIEEAEA